MLAPTDLMLRSRAKRGVSKHGIAHAAGSHPSRRAPADGALQVEEVFLEALQHFEHGLAVVQEYVAPHRRVGGGDAREIAEAAGGEAQYLAVEMAGEIIGRADNGVGDEMRQMRGDGEDAVVIDRIEPLDLAAQALPERFEHVDGDWIAAGQRRQD